MTLSAAPSSVPGLRLQLMAAVLAVTGLADPLRAQVQVEGLEGALLENVLVHLDLDDESCDAPSWRIEEQFDRSEEEIRAALQAFGYYGAEVSRVLSFDEDCWTAGFEVQLGDPVLLRRVEISLDGEAVDDPDFARLIENAGLEQGNALVHPAYDDLKRGLLDLAQRRGYAEASFTASRIDVYPSEYVADITLRMESGPRYEFGDIESDQAVLDQMVLERYYDFGPGDPYDRDRLTSLYAALVDSGYFNSVDVRPLDADAETKRIPVSVTVTAGRRLLLSYGVGFSTDTGPRFRVGRTNRRLNTRGAQFGINAQLSPVISELTFNYRFPYGDPRSEWISLDAGVKHEDTETAVSDSLEFGARRVVTRRGGWQETQLINLLIEDFKVGEERSRSRLLMPGINWFNVEADSTLRPQQGRRLGLQISGAADALGSDTSFVQLGADGKWVWSFENTGRLLVRGRVGITWEDDFIKLPPSVRFFAGGDNSIRGYEFESLGPTDAQGNVIGGNRLLVGSVEYEQPVTGPWSVAFFVDSGNAFRDTDFKTRTGIGTGFRWQSPLGPIRVDVAWPQDGLDRDPRLHVSLGADL